MQPGDLTQLQTLRNQYFALVPSRLLRLPSPALLASTPGQTYLLSNLLNDSHFPQPEDGYRRLFWRGLMRELESGLRQIQLQENPSRLSQGEDEDEGLEIDERFYELMAGLMVGPNLDQSGIDPQQSHRTFIYTIPAIPSSSTPSTQAPTSDTKSSERHITLLEEQTVLQGGTTGLRTWTAALHLGHHLLHHPHTLLLPRPNNPDLSRTSSTILELGAGTGFLSCLIAQQGYRVISTDLGDVLGGGLSPLVRLKHNVKLNDLQNDIRVQELDWMDAQREEAHRPAIWEELRQDPPEMIIAADVIYDPDLVPPLVAALRTLLHYPRGNPQEPIRQAIIAATVRNRTTLDLFVENCWKSNLDVVDVVLPPVDLENPTFWDSGLDVSVPVRIFRVTRRMQMT